MSQISHTNPPIPTAPDNDLPVHIPTPANAQLASLSNTNGAWANFVGSVIVVMGWLKPSSLWNFLGMITVVLSVITTSTMYHRELQAGENIVFFSAFVAALLAYYYKILSISWLGQTRQLFKIKVTLYRLLCTVLPFILVTIKGVLSFINQSMAVNTMDMVLGGVVAISLMWIGYHESRPDAPGWLFSTDYSQLVVFTLASLADFAIKIGFALFLVLFSRVRVKKKLPTQVQEYSAIKYTQQTNVTAVGIALLITFVLTQSLILWVMYSAGLILPGDRGRTRVICINGAGRFLALILVWGLLLVLWNIWMRSDPQAETEFLELCARAGFDFIQEVVVVDRGRF